MSKHNGLQRDNVVDSGGVNGGGANGGGANGQGHQASEVRANGSPGAGGERQV